MISSAASLLVISALIIANISALNDQKKLENPMELAILWDNIKTTTSVQSPYRSFYEVTLGNIHRYFRLGGNNTRVAIVEFDHHHCDIRLNLTDNVRLPGEPKSGGRSLSDPSGLDMALKDVKSKLFVQARPKALKVVFMILASGQGLLKESERIAAELQHEKVLIYATVFLDDRNESIRRLHAITDGESNVYTILRLAVDSSKISLLADQVLNWLTQRIATSPALKSAQDQPSPATEGGMESWAIALLGWFGIFAVLLIIVFIVAVVKKLREKKKKRANNRLGRRSMSIYREKHGNGVRFSGVDEEFDKPKTIISAH